MRTAPADEGRIDPDHCHQTVGDTLSPFASAAAIRLYLGTSDRHNVLPTSCPRAYEMLEPEADMSWEVLTRVVDQTSNTVRLVLHGIGEPMLIKGAELNDTGLDEPRVSLYAANVRTFQRDRGRDRAFREVHAREGLARLRLTLCLARRNEMLQQFTEFVKVAHDIGVGEVHLQRLIFFESDATGLAMAAVSQRRRNTVSQETKNVT
jgi:hypothetical protein